MSSAAPNAAPVSTKISADNTVQAAENWSGTLTWENESHIAAASGDFEDGIEESRTAGEEKEDVVFADADNKQPEIEQDADEEKKGIKEKRKQRRNQKETETQKTDNIEEGVVMKGRGKAGKEVQAREDLDIEEAKGAKRAKEYSEVNTRKTVAGNRRTKVKKAT